MTVVKEDHMSVVECMRSKPRTCQARGCRLFARLVDVDQFHSASLTKMKVIEESHSSRYAGA